MALSALVVEGSTGKKWSLRSLSILKMMFMLDKVSHGNGSEGWTVCGGHV